MATHGVKRNLRPNNLIMDQKRLRSPYWNTVLVSFIPSKDSVLWYFSWKLFKYKCWNKILSRCSFSEKHYYWLQWLQEHAVHSLWSECNMHQATKHSLCVCETTSWCDRTLSCRNAFFLSAAAEWMCCSPLGTKTGTAVWSESQSVHDLFIIQNGWV